MSWISLWAIPEVIPEAGVRSEVGVTGTMGNGGSNEEDRSEAIPDRHRMCPVRYHSGVDGTGRAGIRRDAFPCRIVGTTWIRLDIVQAIQIGSPLGGSSSPASTHDAGERSVASSTLVPQRQRQSSGAKTLGAGPVGAGHHGTTELSGASTSPDSLTNCTTKCTTRTGKLDLGSVH